MSDCKCAHCGTEIQGEPYDTTYSNITTHRCNAGDHTGDIYKCEACEELTIDDFLTGETYGFSY